MREIYRSLDCSPVSAKVARQAATIVQWQGHDE